MKLAKKIEECLIESIVDGEGFRLTLFTQGCIHHCKGCQNPTTWNVDGGFDYEVEKIAEYILNKYKKYKNRYAGITFSGGDPLLQKQELKQLLDILKNEEPNMNIWIYTGYETDEVINDYKELIPLVDVFVTGKFIEEKLDYECEFRGSSNQELIRTKDLIEKSNVLL